MAAGSTYEMIASTTLSSLSTSITFNSIPQTYTDIVAVTYIPTAQSGNDTYMRINGDTTATNYGSQSLDGQTNISAAAALANGAGGLLICFQYGYTDSTDPLFINTHISNYANTNAYKSILSTNASGYSTINPVTINVGVWRSTSAINSLTFNIGNNAVDMGIGTIVTLYGIAEA